MAVEYTPEFFRKMMKMNRDQAGRRETNTFRNPSPTSPDVKLPRVRFGLPASTRTQTMNPARRRPQSPEPAPKPGVAYRTDTPEEPTKRTRTRPSAAPKTSPRPTSRPVNVYTNLPTLSAAMKRPQFRTLRKMTNRDMYDK